MADRRTVAKRDGQVKLSKGMISKGNEIMNDFDKSRNPTKELSVLLKNIRSKKLSIEELNENILNTIEPDDIEEEMEQSSEFGLFADTEIEILSEFLQKLDCTTKEDECKQRIVVDPPRTDSKLDGNVVVQDFDNRSTYSSHFHGESSHPNHASVRRRQQVRLPKFEMKKYGGDPIAWPEFFETFRISIHENEDLTDIERFTYLKGYVFGEAANCIQGLPLTSGNYFESLRLLENRFGNKKLIISKHMDALLDLGKINSSSMVKELRSLYDKIMVNIRALKAYGITSEQFGPMLSPVIMKMLPNDIKLEVNRRLLEDWSIDDLLSILCSEIKTHESCVSQKEESKRKSDKRDKSPTHTTESLLSSNRPLVCAFCSGKHFSDKCTVVSDVSARYEMVKKNKLCFRCLQGNNHKVQRCKSKLQCFYCNSIYHHTALHHNKNKPEFSENENSTARAPTDNNNNKTEVNSKSMISASLNNRCPVFLETIRVKVSADMNGSHSIMANILFDLGSMKTYVSKSFAGNLDLKRIGSERVRIGVFGDSEGKVNDLDVFDLYISSVSNGMIKISASAIPTICGSFEDQRIYIEELKKRFDIDQYMSEDQVIAGEINILIGADFYHSIVDRKVIEITDNLILKSSKIGYMLSGSEYSPDIENVSTFTTTCIQTLSSTSDKTFISKPDLDDKVQKFWDLDSIGITSNEQSVCDKVVEKIEFIDGRYVVELPMKEGHPLIQDNYFPSVKRLGILKGKLEKNGLLESYDDIIKEQIDLGIVEVVGEDETPPILGEVTYIPHRAVVRPDKITTKVRVVYDCSAKSGGTSLNDCLYKGPCLTPLIFDSILRFRLNNVALVADIASAYLQISVAPPQKDLLRFLWFANAAGNDFSIKKLRFTRLIYGAAPSQYLLNAVIRKHAEKYLKIDPDFVKIVNDGFYVDDLNVSVHSSAEGVDFYQKVKLRFGEANFNVRKWRSNDVVVQKLIKDKEENFEHLENGKVLGIPWVEKDDVFLIQLNDFVTDSSSEKITKRFILKVVAGFYDPAGWIQPAVVKLKMIFQDAWKSGLHWDEELPVDLVERWRNAISDLLKCSEIRIPRCYCRNDDSNPIERVDLHGFSDASLNAYGACVYLKFTLKNGDVYVSLVASKSRVAPLKTVQTIPRLELMGNLILARLVEAVMNAVKDNLTIGQVFCHTDSKVSLSWVKGVRKEFQTFVQNRVDEIRRKIAPEKWFYCRTDQNPADLLTRADNDGLSQSLWWHGPEFFQSSDVYCDQPPERGEDEIREFDHEVKVQKSTTALVNSNENTSIDNVIDISKYGDVLRLFRVTACVLRFVNNLKNKIKKIDPTISKYPSVVEMREAHNLWIRSNQSILCKQPGYEQLRIQLNCVVGEDGIIRSHGRMKNAKIAANSKAPILLSKTHRLSVLLVLYSHTKVLHRIKQTLSELRSKYWVTRGRSFVKKIVGPCVVCKKLNSRPYEYPGHSDLPDFRFDDRFPFSSTGCDYLGPLHVQPIYGNTKKLYKAWIVLYTCTASRAVILDVVNSTNAGHFLQSFRRFVARRGSPSLMVSDNGSCFVADETQQYVTNHLIDWKFNVPCAPWMGGIWERIVSCVKKCLKRTIGRRRVNFVELQTLVLEVEAILNNRPICDDHDDDIDDVLTPNHLIFGRRIENSNFARVSIDSFEDEHLNKREKHLEKMISYFWEIWRKEYVTSLREKHKSSKEKPEIVSVNDIVIIYDDKQPRHMWKIGRVDELIRSKDGIVRAAKVQTGQGPILSRPLCKLYPIELRKKSSD